MSLPPKREEWFEVWYVPGVDFEPALLVVVMPNPQKAGEIVVKDQCTDTILYKSDSYEDVRVWLTEDEFGFVVGREDMP
jgi:hypothetical protein